MRMRIFTRAWVLGSSLFPGDCFLMMYVLHVLSPEASYVCRELFLARLIIESLNSVTVHNYTGDQRARKNKMVV